MPLRRLLVPLAQSFWRLRRAMTLGVRVLAQREDGAVMLVRHTYLPGWYLPGGGVETNELAHEAAERELAEEAGLIAEAPLQLLSIHANFAQMRSDHVLFYRAPAWRAGVPAEQGEIAERGWFSLEALPEGVTRATRQRLAEALHGEPPSPVW